MKKGGFLSIIIILLSLAYCSKAKGQCTYLSSTVYEYIVMEQGGGGVALMVYNFSAIEYITRVTFYFDSLTYVTISGNSYNSPTWVCSVYDGSNDGLPGTYALSCDSGGVGIPPGNSEIFIIYLGGPGYGSFTSDTQDVADRLSNIYAEDDTGKSCTLLSSFPTWRRRSLDVGLKLWAIPFSLIPGDIVNVEMEVANRSQSTWTVYPSITTSGPISINSPPSPSSLTLNPGQKEIFRWSYLVTGFGDITISAYATNSAGTATSLTVDSNPLVSDELNSYLFTRPYYATWDENFELWFSVYRKEDVSAGIVEPNLVLTSADGMVSTISGPDPLTYPAIPTGGSAGFNYVRSLSSGTTYASFQAQATAYYPVYTVSNFSTADVKGIPPGKFAYLVNLSSYVLYPGSATPITFTVEYPGWSGNLCSFFVKHNPDFAYVTGSASGGYNGFSWGITEIPNGVTFYALSPPIDCIPDFGGGAGEFILNYDIPSVSSETMYYIYTESRTDTSTILQSTPNVLIMDKRITLSRQFSGSLTANGESKGIIKATLKDIQGNPLSNRNLVFFTKQGMFPEYWATTDSTGTASITFVAPFSPSSLTGEVMVSYKYLPSDYLPYSFNEEKGFVETITFPLGPFSGGNLLYAGGTLYPLTATKAIPVSFSMRVINMGDSPKNITTASDFEITDGVNTYTASLSQDVTIYPGQITYLSFEEKAIPSFFSEGLYLPIFFYTGPGGDPDRTVWDNVALSTYTASPILFFYAVFSDGTVSLYWSYYGDYIDGFKIIREDGVSRVILTPELIPYSGEGEYFYGDNYTPITETRYLLMVIVGENSYIAGSTLVNPLKDFPQDDITVIIPVKNAYVTFSCSFKIGEEKGLLNQALIFLFLILPLFFKKIPFYRITQ